MIFGTYMFTEYFNIPYDWDHMPPWSVSLLYKLYLMACYKKEIHFNIKFFITYVPVCV